jgi:hypothetical protein
MNAPNDHIFIGTREVFGQQHPVSLSLADRRFHTYVIGKTGVGKSTLLKNLIIQDVLAGRGVAFLDPHGDSAEELLDFIPSHRTRDVVYFNAGDLEFPMAWNLLHVEDPGRRHMVAEDILEAFRGVWGHSWGPQLEYILLACIQTLLDVENTSLLGVSRLLSDLPFRKRTVERVKDEAIRRWWQEFEQRERRSQAEAIAPVQNKVGRLVLSPTMRNIFGQTNGKATAAWIMDTNKIFIANLSKGQVGSETASILGALLISQFQHAALARARLPEAERKDYHLAIDEFQSFPTSSFATILSEARKYRLSLTLAHQYIDQVPEHVRSAIFGNVGTLISFRVGEQDGAHLEREYGDGYTQRHFSGLDNHKICVRLTEGGRQQAPFTGSTFPVDPALRFGRRAQIIRSSRERFATPRDRIEEKLSRWMTA